MLSKQSPFKQMLRFRIKKGNSLKNWHVAALVVFTYAIVPFTTVVAAPFVFTNVSLYAICAIGLTLTTALHIFLSRAIRPKLTTSLRPAQVGMVWLLPISYAVFNFIVLSYTATMLALKNDDTLLSGLATSDGAPPLLAFSIACAVNAAVIAGLVFAARKSVAKQLQKHALNDHSAKEVFENIPKTEQRIACLSIAARKALIVFTVILTLIFIPASMMNFDNGVTIAGVVNTIFIPMEIALLWIIILGIRISGPLALKQIAVALILLIEFVSGLIVEQNIQTGEDISAVTYAILSLILYVPMLVAFSWYAVKRLPYEHTLPKGKPNPRAVF